MELSCVELQKHVNALTQALGVAWRFSVLHTNDGNAVIRGEKDDDERAPPLSPADGSQALVFKRFSTVKNFVLEHEILRNLDHPLIIKSELKTWLQLPPRTVAMAYHPFGNLMDVCHALDRAMSREEAWFVFEQTADALSYLHDNGVIHGDLKSTNVLLDAEGRIKLIDFSVSMMNTGPNEVFRYPHDAHSSKHMAPEARAKDLCTAKIDCFSLANLVCQVGLMSNIGSDPLINDTQLCGRLLILLEAEFFLLLLELLRTDASKRMSSSELFQDVRFSELHKHFSGSCRRKASRCHLQDDCIAGNRFPGLEQLRESAK